MKNMTLGNIAAACGGYYYGTAADRERSVEAVTTDSRDAKNRHLFVPIKGTRVDGHDFIKDVTAKGAYTLSEYKLEAGQEPYILVESTTQALKDIAEFYRQQLSCRVVGVVGSVGKTSTKEMIASVLSQHYRVLKTQGNFNNEIGVPLTLFRIREEHEVAVLEMGISDFGEMHRLAKMVRPDVIVMTNIGTCHLENLVDRDGVLKAKSEVFDFANEQTIVLLNGEDDKLCTLTDVKGRSPMFFGIDTDSMQQADMIDTIGRKNLEFYASNIKNHGLEGMTADIHLNREGSWSVFPVMIPLPGEHNILNALAGAAAGCVSGLDDAQIQRGIANIQAIQGRSNFIKAGNITIIDDCYNANPMSMKASLDILSSAKGRKIAVLGDMGELGEEEKALHAEVGEYAAGTGITALFLCGELSKEMQRAANRKNRMLVTAYYKTKEEMLPALIPFLQAGDTVLVKASHFMEFSNVVEELQKVVAFPEVI